MRSSRSQGLFALSILLTIAGAAQAESVRLDLRSENFDAFCGSDFSGSGYGLQVLPGSSSIYCPGDCLASNDAAGLHLTPGTFSLTINPALSGWTEVEVRLIERDPVLSATARMHSPTSILDVDEGLAPGNIVLRVRNESERGTRLSVECCDCTVWLIQISGDVLVGVLDGSWTSLKARYR